MDVVVSPEDLAGYLEAAAADVAVEQALLPVQPGPHSESIFMLTDQFLGGSEPSLPLDVAASFSGDQVALLGEVKESVNKVWAELKIWRRETFNAAADKLKALADKIIELARKLGVTTAHMIGRLQRRLTGSIVENSILPPFSVGDGSNTQTFATSEVTTTSTVKSAPALAEISPTAAVQLLSGLLKFELAVTVKYTARQT